MTMTMKSYVCDLKPCQILNNNCNNKARSVRRSRFHRANERRTRSGYLAVSLYKKAAGRKEDLCIFGKMPVVFYRSVIKDHLK